MRFCGKNKAPKKFLAGHERILKDEEMAPCMGRSRRQHSVLTSSNKIIRKVMLFLRNLCHVLTCLALLTHTSRAEVKARRTVSLAFSPLSKIPGYRLRCMTIPPMRLRGGCADPSFAGLEKQPCLVDTQAKETPSVYNSLTKKKELLRLLCDSSDRRVLMYAVRISPPHCKNIVFGVLQQNLSLMMK